MTAKDMRHITEMNLSDRKTEDGKRDFIGSIIISMGTYLFDIQVISVK
jgi:hypothetical protein